MTKIIYDENGLTIDVYYDRKSHEIKWSIQSDSDNTPIFNVNQLKTIIEELDKSIDFDWEPKL